MLDNKGLHGLIYFFQTIISNLTTEEGNICEDIWLHQIKARRQMKWPKGQLKPVDQPHSSCITRKKCYFQMLCQLECIIVAFTDLFIYALSLVSLSLQFLLPHSRISHFLPISDWRKISDQGSSVCCTDLLQVQTVKNSIEKARTWKSLAG